eukprot:755696-Hanusia_phi.AAC.5
MVRNEQQARGWEQDLSTLLGPLIPCSAIPSDSRVSCDKQHCTLHVQPPAFFLARNYHDIHSAYHVFRPVHSLRHVHLKMNPATSSPKACYDNCTHWLERSTP